MGKILKIVDKFDRLKNLGKYYQQYPAKFIKDYCGWYIWSKQIEIANAMVKNERVAVPASFGCLSGDTVIPVNRGGKNFKSTIKMLYNTHNGNSGKLKGMKGLKGDHIINVRSYDDDVNRIRLNGTLKFIYSGYKGVYRLILKNGKKIKVTKDHKILTKNGFIELQHLTDEDMIMCDRPLSFSKKKFNQDIPIYSKIKSIKYIGYEDVYDISCKSPYHNFVANGIVVHNCGKTYIAARIAIWFLLNYKDSIVVTTAPTGRQVRDLFWSEIRNANSISKRILAPNKPLTTMWRIDSKWYMVGFSTKDDDVDKFTGYHSAHILLVFDQACGIAPDVWTAGEALMTSDHVRWLAISNTTDSQSEFANICLPDRKSAYGNDWKIIKIKAEETPNIIAGSNLIPGLISHNWIEKKKQVWTYLDPLWQIFVEANFVEASAMVVLTETMRKELFDIDIEPDFENIEIGIDVADQGVDRSVWTVRGGPRLLFIESVNGFNPSQVVRKTQEIWKKVVRLTNHQPIEIRVDSIGVGSGVMSRLEELGYPVVGVNVAKSAIIDKDKYLNLRAELSWTFREMIEGKLVCLKSYYSTDENIIEDLKGEMGIRYKLTLQGKTQIESKDDFKKRIKRSPDIFDSVIFAYTNPGEIPVIEIMEPISDNIDKPMRIEEKVEKELQWIEGDDDDDDY